MLTATPWYYLPQFRPARLQDCVFWLESDSFNGGIWRNLVPRYSDTNHGIAYGGVGLSTWHPHANPIPEFHAEDDYIDLPMDIVFDDEMSIEIVFELYDDIDNGRIIGSQHSGGDHYQIRTYVTSTKKFYFTIANGSTIFDVSFYLDDWYDKTHGVWTWKYDSGTDQTTVKAFKDGEYKNMITFDGKVQLPDINLRLAHYLSFGMNGKIYLARFYHKVLSEDEIRHNYTHHPIYYLQHGIDPYQVIAAATAAAAPSI